MKNRQVEAAIYHSEYAEVAVKALRDAVQKVVLHEDP